MSSKVLVAILLCIAGTLAGKKTALVRTPFEKSRVSDVEGMPEVRGIREARGSGYSERQLVETPNVKPEVEDTRVSPEDLLLAVSERDVLVEAGHKIQRNAEVLPIEGGEGRSGREPGVQVLPVDERMMEKRTQSAVATSQGKL